jgi:hypothetical protein
MYIYSHVCVRMNKYIRIYMNIYIYVSIYTHKYVYIYMYIHIHIYTYIYTLSGISKNQSSTPLFMAAVQSSIAKSINVPVTAVIIQSITSTTTARRLLLASGVDIVFTVNLDNGDSKV